MMRYFFFSLNLQSFSERGFTFVELVINMATISILGAIMMSIFTDYKKQAYDVQALSLMHDMASALETVVGDVERRQYGLADYSYLKVPGSEARDLGDLETTASTLVRISDFLHIDDDRIFAFVSYNTDIFSYPMPERTYYIWHCDGETAFQRLESVSLGPIVVDQIYMELPITNSMKTSYCS